MTKRILSLLSVLALVSGVAAGVWFSNRTLVNAQDNGYSIRVTAPNGGERFTAGQATTIRWAVRQPPGLARAAVDVYLFPEQGRSTLIRRRVSLTSIKWNIPRNIAPGKYRIGVEARGIPMDKSDAVFQIDPRVTQQNNAQVRPASEQATPPPPPANTTTPPPTLPASAAFDRPSNADAPLLTGQNTLLRFQLTARNQPVRIEQLNFTVQTNGQFTVSDYRIYRETTLYTDPNNPDTAQAVGDAQSTPNFNLTEVVQPGSAGQVYTLRASVSGNRPLVEGMTATLSAENVRVVESGSGNAVTPTGLPLTFRLGSMNAPTGDLMITTNKDLATYDVYRGSERVGGGQGRYETYIWNLTEGTYRVVFNAIANDPDAPPAPVEKQVRAMERNTVHGEYQAPRLTVTSDKPQATFDVLRRGTRINGGEGTGPVYFYDLQEDTYTVRFNDIPNESEEPPASIDIRVTSAGGARVHGDYSVPAALQEVLVVTTDNVNGSFEVFDSTNRPVDNRGRRGGNGTGTVRYQFLLTEGPYRVEFYEVTGFRTPDPVTVQVTPGGNYERATGVYVPVQ